MISEKSFDVDGRDGSQWTKSVRPVSITATDVREFNQAMQAYKIQSGRMFPTWSEVLEVIRSLGYEKRIWKPVGPWSPISTALFDPSEPVSDLSGVVGWYSRVETPLVI